MAVPETLEDYVATAEALTEDGFYGRRDAAAARLQIMEEWKNWLYAAGGSLFDAAGNVAIDSPEARRALELYHRDLQRGRPPGFAELGLRRRPCAPWRPAVPRPCSATTGCCPTLNAEGGVAGDLAGNFRLHEVPGGQGRAGRLALVDRGQFRAAGRRLDLHLLADRQGRSTASALSRAARRRRRSVVSDEEVWEQGFGEELLHHRPRHPRRCGAARHRYGGRGDHRDRRHRTERGPSPGRSRWRRHSRTPHAASSGRDRLDPEPGRRPAPPAPLCCGRRHDPVPPAGAGAEVRNTSLGGPIAPCISDFRLILPLALALRRSWSTRWSSRHGSRSMTTA